MSEARTSTLAFWITVALMVPVFYVASFGPACWIAATRRVPGQRDVVRLWMRPFFPIGAVVHRTRSQENALLKWWITCGAGRGGRVLVPTDPSGTNWYGFTAK
ncbi:MAG: hypothetical protein ACT4QC_17105 [Planctomycetaceae bacterium]